MNERRSTRLAVALFAAVCAAGWAPVQAGRLALVIGNDAYSYVQPLSNAGNDARLIAETLKQAGFEVVGGVRTNLNREQMWNALGLFKSRINKGDSVVFYFAGHGVQIHSDAMLLGVDISAETDEQVLHDGLNLEDVQDEFKDAGFALLIIDACRDNPFPPKPGRSISQSRGLLPVQPATGNLILMAAGPGQSALDMVPGITAKDGLFTYTLVQALKTPGLDVRTAMYKVRDDVEDEARRANHKQRPSVVDDMRGSFSFFPGTAGSGQKPPNGGHLAPVASTEVSGAAAEKTGAPTVNATDASPGSAGSPSFCGKLTDAIKWAAGNFSGSAPNFISDLEDPGPDAATWPIAKDVGVYLCSNAVAHTFGHLQCDVSGFPKNQAPLGVTQVREREQALVNQLTRCLGSPLSTKDTASAFPDVPVPQPSKSTLATWRTEVGGPAVYVLFSTQPMGTEQVSKDGEFGQLTFCPNARPHCRNTGDKVLNGEVFPRSYFRGR